MADNRLGPRNKNALVQALPMEGRATFLPYQDTLPGSVMNQRSFALPGIIAGAVNAFTAPGRAYSGSDQSFDPAAEAANFAMTTMGGGMGASRLAPAPRNALGMNVYQGSPHRFPPTAKNPLGEFDASKIGTGEGAQAYGHGHYSAEAKDLAKGYAVNLSNRDMANQNRLNAHANAQRLANLAGDPKYAANDIKFVLETQPDHPQAQLLRETLQLLDSGEYKNPLKNAGNLYTIDLPDEHIAKMLHWDKPLSEQHPDVQAAIKNLHGKDALGRPINASPIDENTTGQWLYQALQEGRNQKLTSQALRDAGVPGIRYFDGSSRAAGEGTSNFVVFPGNEDMMKIINRE
jgi:hypothetical protein